MWGGDEDGWLPLTLPLTNCTPLTLPFLLLLSLTGPKRRSPTKRRTKARGEKQNRWKAGQGLSIDSHYLFLPCNYLLSLGLGIPWLPLIIQFWPVIKSHTMVIPIIRYECETWTMKKPDRNKINLFVLEESFTNTMNCKKDK